VEAGCQPLQEGGLCLPYVADHQGQLAADMRAQDCYCTAELMRTSAQTGRLAGSACKPPAFCHASGA
jgi:hypothetical protein